MTTPRIKGYKFGPFVLDLEERELLKSGKRVYLQLKALDLLVVLIENRGHGVTKDELMTRIWGQDVFVDESNLPHHISTLRKTLGQPPDDQRFVETLPRRGYRWVAPVKEITDLGVAQRRKDAKSPKGGSIDSDDAGPDLHTDPSGGRLPQNPESEPGRSHMQPRATPNNLRLRAAPLIGREADIQTIVSRILRDDVRLLTAEGGPGVGKTSVVIEVARSLMAEFPDGVFVVELAPIRDPPSRCHSYCDRARSQRNGEHAHNGNTGRAPVRETAAAGLG
jgi:DNA-binding winged helix-turn-helix (wHTH) protein